MLECCNAEPSNVALKALSVSWFRTVKLYLEALGNWAGVKRNDGLNLCIVFLSSLSGNTQLCLLGHGGMFSVILSADIRFCVLPLCCLLFLYFQCVSQLFKVRFLCPKFPNTVDISTVVNCIFIAYLCCSPFLSLSPSHCSCCSTLQRACRKKNKPSSSPLKIHTLFQGTVFSKSNTKPCFSLLYLECNILHPSSQMHPGDRCVCASTWNARWFSFRLRQGPVSHLVSG